MEEVQQVLRARQSEFEAIREEMQEELERNAQRLDEARRQYEEVRQQSAQVRQQAEAALQEALRERQRIVREQLGQGFPAPMLGDPGFPFTTGGAQMYFRADSAVWLLRGDSVTYLRDDAPWMVVPELLERFNQQNSLRPPVTVGIPAVTGQRFVAGVELTNLNPSLARYFGVEAGVLVTAVTDRSPGDSAGILAGDVIVEVGDEAVTTVQEVRQAMNRRSATRIVEPGRFDLELRSPAPITLRVIREGQTLDLEIPR
jgi:C-terminal processing protease CtpA/Prc